MNTWIRNTFTQSWQRVRAFIILTVSLSLVYSIETIAAQQNNSKKVYSMSNDFHYPDNPNGAWSYGYKTRIGSEPTGAFYLLPAYPDVPDLFSSVNGQVWHNTQEAIAYDIPLGWVSINGGGYTTSTVRFTAPRGGLIKVSGIFGQGGGQGLRGIFLNNIQVWSADAYGRGGHFNFLEHVQRGDTIDLIVWDGGWCCGNTPVDATVDYQE